MGLKGCEIVLDNKEHVYCPGDTVSGYVEFEFDAVKKVRGIYVVFKGAALTRWTEERIKKPKVTVACCGKEEYFTHSYYLLGDAIAFKSHKYEIAPGTHRYPITCTLPTTLPSSFEGEFGHVRYTITVILDRPWKFDQGIKMAYTVVDRYDLNSIPDCKSPIHIQMEEVFCCYWCRSSPLTLNVFIPLQGYCTGQEVPLEILCDNKSDVDVNSILITFRQVTKYMCQIPMHEIKIERKEICKRELAGIVSGTKRSWLEHITVPPLPPTTLKNCNIIDTHYDIKVKCLHSGIHPDIKAKTPILIGTIPIVVVDPSLHAGQEAHSNDILSLYPVLNTPEYQEGSYRASSILEESNDNPHLFTQNNQFAPKYPTYKFKCQHH